MATHELDGIGGINSTEAMETALRVAEQDEEQLIVTLRKIADILDRSSREERVDKEQEVGGLLAGIRTILDSFSTAIDTLLETGSTGIIAVIRGGLDKVQGDFVRHGLGQIDIEQLGNDIISLRRLVLLFLFEIEPAGGATQEP